MKKSNWQYVITILLFMCIIGIAIIGFLMGLIISKGPQASESAKYFLGLQHHQWGNIHIYLFIAFVILGIIQIILSWSWIKGKAHQLFHRGWKSIFILTTVVFFLVLFLFWAFYPKALGTHEDYAVRAGSRAKVVPFEKSHSRQEEKISIRETKDSIVITDQMTLLDVEKATGIPAREIADKLGLPSKVSLNKALENLRKRYPFTLQKVRDVVTELLNKKKALEQEKKEAEETQIKREQKIKIKEEVRPKQKLIRGRMAAVPSGILITGKMTLYDLEDITDIPARKIADELGIPSNALINEHLGRLRKKYLFSMQKVRDVVASLMKKNRKEK